MAASDEKRITLGMLKYYKTKQDSINDGKFVAIVENKHLISSSDQAKLDGIAAGAQVNVIESVSIDGVAQVIENKAMTLDLSAYAKLTDIATVYRFKGSVATYGDLPTYDASEEDNPRVGDVYNITTADAVNDINAGDNVVCSAVDTVNGTVTWDNLAGIVDLSSYATINYVTTTLANYVTTATFNKVVDGDVNDATNYPGLVRQVAGKGLSTNDFDDNYKAILDRGDATKKDILMEIFGYSETDANDELNS